MSNMKRGGTGGGAGGGAGGNNNSNTYYVKNRAPAPIQISAEQIVREAADRQEIFPVQPINKIQDSEEYQSYLRDRRKQYEDNIRYRREHIGTWIKYAKFEEENKQYERSRSIYERCLEVVQSTNAELWIRYIEFEIRNEFINHARNLLDRAVILLPRKNFLWYKYVYIEEMIGDIIKTRAVFERWMEWLPDDSAWIAYAKFEVRHNNIQNAENILRNYVNTFRTANAFIKFTKFIEFEIHDYELCRTIYESSLNELEQEEILYNCRLLKNFASFEERRGEYDRARTIYKYAISLYKLDDSSDEKNNKKRKITTDDDDNDSTDSSLTEQEIQRRKELYQSYIIFEKKHGTTDIVDTVIIQQQRTKYENDIQNNTYDYDVWFDYIQLEEQYQLSLVSSSSSSKQQNTNGNTSVEVQQQIERVRDVYERAISNKPPRQPPIKNEWKRYIYLWIYYATYEELYNNNIQRSCQIYTTVLNKIIPHTIFTFTKLWLYAAKVHIRHYDISTTRKLLGRAIGYNPTKHKIYNEYISIELSLGEIDRCRLIYNKYIQSLSTNASVWIKYSSFEKSLGEITRCRAIYELALQRSTTTTTTSTATTAATSAGSKKRKKNNNNNNTQQVIVVPPIDRIDIIWKSYIDFEMEESEYENVRALYKRLLDETETNKTVTKSNVKVWIAYALFEGNLNVATTTTTTTRESESQVPVVVEEEEETSATKDDEKNSNDDGSSIVTSAERARSIFQTAYDKLKQKFTDTLSIQNNDTTGNNDNNNNNNNNEHDPTTIQTTLSRINEDRVILLDAWKVYELKHGTFETINTVNAMMPRRIKRKRMRYATSTGDQKQQQQQQQQQELGWEEYFDYQFPDDNDTIGNLNSTTSDAAASNFKLLQMAEKWKEQQKQLSKQTSDDDNDDDDSSDDDDDDEEDDDEEKDNNDDNNN